MYVCVCNGVTEGQIREAVVRGAQTIRALRDELGIVDTCGRCAHCAVECLTRHLEGHHCGSDCPHEASACEGDATWMARHSQ